MNRRSVSLAVLPLFAGLGLAPQAQAVQVFYGVESVTTNGIINLSRFNGRQALFHLYADTDAITVQNGLLYTPLTQTYCQILSKTAGYLSEPFQLVLDPALGMMSLQNASGSERLTFQDNSLIGYDLRSGYGPIVAGSYDDSHFLGPLSATFGTLQFSRMTTPAFYAEVQPTATPEPGALAWWVVGGGTMGLLRRRCRTTK